MEQTIYEPIGRVTMGPAKPIIDIFAELTATIDGDKVVVFNKFRTVQRLDPDTDQIIEVEEPGLETIGRITKTSSGKSYNLNIFGKTQIINAEQYDQLKLKKVGGIGSVTISTPTVASQTPVGVRSAFKRLNGDLPPAPTQTRRERIEQSYIQ